MLEANQVLDLAFRWEFSQKKKELKGILQAEFKEVEKMAHTGAAEVSSN